MADTLTYKGHAYIRIVGDSHKPARFWTVTLLTQAELDQVDLPERGEYRTLRQSDMSIIQLQNL